MRKSTIRTMLRVGSALGMLTISAMAAAQDAPQGEEPGFGDIVVTADKRAERLQDVPASVSAVTGDQLQAVRATQLADYAGYVLGLVFTSRGGQGHGYIALRGLAPLGETAAVGTYIDDTPVGSSSGLAAGSSIVVDLTPYDVERVEVLRGPQGTLYGANALGGLIKYVTVQPDTGDASVRLGGELSDTAHGGGLGWAVRGALNLPVVTDTLAVRGSFLLRRSPGYVDNPRLDLSDINDARQVNARLAMLWQASDDVTIRLSGLYQRNRADGSSHVSLDPVTLKPAGGDLPQQRHVLTGFDQRLQHYSGSLAWSLGGAELLSITSYSRGSSRDTSDLTEPYAAFIPLFCGLLSACPPNTTGIVPLKYRSRVAKFTQEVRLSSTGETAFKWMVGGFYTDETASYHQDLQARRTDGTLITGLTPFGTVVLDSGYEEKSLFGNLGYSFGDLIDIGAGLRWARNDQVYSQITTGPMLGEGNVPNNRSSEDVVTYMANAQLHLARDAMLYARFATGYRPGGPNVALPGVPPKVNSDSTRNYEIGLKSELFDRRALFNLTAFLIDWDDIQINLLTAQNLGYLANGGKARSKGFEFEAMLRPAQGLQLGVNGAYTDARIRSGAVPLGGKDGDRISFIPRFSGSATADYRTALGTRELHLNLGYRYVGSRFAMLESNPAARRARAYGLVDASAALSDDRWTLRLFTKNLFDKRAFLSPVPLRRGATAVYYVSPVVEPRVIGISLDTRF